MKAWIILSHWVAVVAFAAVPALAEPATEMEDATADKLIRALSPQQGSPDIKYRGIPRRTERGLTIEPAEGGESETVKDLPSVALRIPFEFDSARLTPEARDLLREVAAAMQSEKLSRYHFLLEGHTDSVGAASYNQDLSVRRSQAVRDFLVRQHGLDPDRLATRGHGERFLLDAQNPESGRNRRVEITNIGS